MSPFTDLRKSHPNERLFDQPPLPMDAEGLASDFKHYYSHTFGRDKDSRSAYYPYRALAVVMRDRLMERWKKTRYAYEEADCKRTYYLSLEFLHGPHPGQRHAQPGDQRRRRNRGCTTWVCCWKRSPRASRMPVSATAAWGAWPPASWTAARPCSCR